MRIDNIFNNQFNYLKGIVPTNCCSLMKETLTKQQKIILTIALAIFSSLAIGVSYYYLRTKKVEQRNNLPPVFYNLRQQQPGDQLKQVDQSLVKESLGKKAIKKIEIDDIWLSIFKFADLGSWCHLSQTNQLLSRLSKNPTVYAFLLNTKQMPSVKMLEFIKLAKASVLHTLDLKGVVFKNSQELEQIFTAFQNLQDVDLDLSSGNWITERLLQKLPSGLKHLKLPSVYSGEDLPQGLLSLSSCKIINATPEKLPPGLTSLKFYDADSLTESELEKLPSSLVSLELDNFNFTGTKIQFPQNLTSLSLPFCNITDEGVKGLRFSNLRSLTLRYCRTVTDAHLEELPGSLTSLDLSGCRLITDAGIEKLPRKLTSLDLSFCNITDVGIAHLPPALTSLTLLGCDRVTEQGIATLPSTLTSFGWTMDEKVTEAMIRNLPRNLTSLDLRTSKQDASYIFMQLKSLVGLKNFLEADVNILDQLPQGLTSLTLDLGKSMLIDANIKKFPPKLKTLTLNNCQKITSVGIRQLPRELISLDLYECSIQDGDLEYFSRHLTSLHLSFCDITDAGIEKLPPKLRALTLGNCGKITNQGIKKFHQGLKELLLKNCSQLTNEGLEHLPGGLRLLWLVGAKKITNEGMQKLPLGLTELAIASCPNVTNTLETELGLKGIQVSIYKS